MIYFFACFCRLFPCSTIQTLWKHSAWKHPPWRLNFNLLPSLLCSVTLFSSELTGGQFSFVSTIIHYPLRTPLKIFFLKEVWMIFIRFPTLLQWATIGSSFITTAKGKADEFIVLIEGKDTGKGLKGLLKKMTLLGELISCRPCNFFNHFFSAKYLPYFVSLTIFRVASFSLILVVFHYYSIGLYVHHRWENSKEDIVDFFWSKFVSRHIWS